MRNKTFWQEPLDRVTVLEASRRWRLSPMMAEFVLRRGKTSEDTLNDLVMDQPLDAPDTLPDMSEAVLLIRQTLKSGGRVRIYGDYDADGVTATAVMVRGLRYMGFGDQVDWYIPNRFDEGYGLHVEAVSRAHQDGIALLVTVDCGSSSPDAADLAETVGLPLIITDHHALPERAPKVAALVNPERMAVVDRLSGAGVALQVMRALLNDQVPELLYAIAAIGTIADVVPILGNNRRLVARGLRAMRSGLVPGIQVLFDLEKRDLLYAGTDDVAFMVGPRLNAAGRMGDAEAAVELLLQDDVASLIPLGGRLGALNQERRAVERAMLEEAWVHLPRDAEGRIFDFPVIAGDNWHPGVVGIVASRFREWLGRPVAVVSWDGEDGKGSARSVPGMNLIAHLRQSADLFTKLGGHPGAAGFSLSRRSSVDLSRQLSASLPLPARAHQRLGSHFDIALRAEDMPSDLWEQVRALEPYGQGFQAPRFLVHGTVQKSRTMGGEHQHLSLELRHHPIRVVAFGYGWQQPALVPGTPVRFLATLETNRYRGQENPQWHVMVLDGPFVRNPMPVITGRPERLPERILWVVDGDAHIGEWSRKFDAAAYLTSLPMGELVALEEEARRGLISQVVTSQWRPWPRLLGWADAVIWLTVPRNQAKWEESAALAAPGAFVWLNQSPHVRVSPQHKLERLFPSRERLGRHWRTWQKGRPGLIIGRAVFDELGMQPERLQPGERGVLEQSFSVQQAFWQQRLDQDEPFSGKDESYGVD